MKTRKNHARDESPLHPGSHLLEASLHETTKEHLFTDGRRQCNNNDYKNELSRGTRRDQVAVGLFKHLLEFVDDSL